MLWGRPLDLLGPNPNPNSSPNRDPPPNLRLPRYLNLHLSRLLASALTSAFEGDHETEVALALVTSLDRTLTLAKAVCTSGPNSNV